MRPNLQMLFGTTAVAAMLVAPVAMQAQTRSDNPSQSEQQQQSDQRQKQRADARWTSQKMSDRHFIEQVAIVNMFEIRVGRMALDRSQDQALREFARRVVNDHRRIQDRLAQLAGQTDMPRGNQGDSGASIRMRELRRARDAGRA